KLYSIQSRLHRNTCRNRFRRQILDYFTWNRAKCGTNIHPRSVARRTDIRSRYRNMPPAAVQELLGRLGNRPTDKRPTPTGESERDAAGVHSLTTQPHSLAVPMNLVCSSVEVRCWDWMG